MSGFVRLRPASLHDLAAVTRLAAAVAWPHRPADLKLMLDLGRGFAAREEASGDTVGVGFWWDCGADAATLGLVMVAPELQGRGIGRQLMQMLLEDSHPRTIRLVATTEGQALYERLGFRPVGGVRQHQGTYAAPTMRAPAVRPAGPSDHEALLALDAEAFGATRDTLMRRLLGVGETVLLEADGRPVGFATRRAFGRGDVVGPIVAPDQERAIDLFRAAARPGFVRVDCPAEATRFAAYLSDVGLPVVDEPVAMLRGNWPTTTGRLHNFGLVSQALG